jgi:hypothetical protein
MADFAFGQVGDEQPLVVHDEREAHLAFDLAKNVPHDGIQHKLAADKGFDHFSTVRVSPKSAKSPGVGLSAYLERPRAQIGLDVHCTTMSNDIRNLPGNFIPDGESIGDDYHAFDLLEQNGENLRPLPYRDRLTCLLNLLASAQHRHVRFSVVFFGSLDVSFQRFHFPFHAGIEIRLIKMFHGVELFPSFTQGNATFFITPRCLLQRNLVTQLFFTDQSFQSHETSL